MTSRPNVSKSTSCKESSGQANHAREQYGRATVDGMDLMVSYNLSQYSPATLEESLSPFWLNPAAENTCPNGGTGKGSLDTAQESIIDPQLLACLDDEDLLLLSPDPGTVDPWSVLGLINERSPTATSDKCYLADETSIGGDHVVTPTSNTSASSPDTQMQVFKRKAHYRVEKRYRTNINDKIRALNDILPGRMGKADGSGQDEEGGVDDGGSQMKRSKGEVLSRTIEYIKLLQWKLSLQEKVIRDIRGRMRASQRALALGF